MMKLKIIGMCILVSAGRATQKKPQAEKARESFLPVVFAGGVMYSWDVLFFACTSYERTLHGLVFRHVEGIALGSLYIFSACDRHVLVGNDVFHMRV